MLRFIELERPVFLIKDADLVLRCQKAFIAPDFREVIQKRAIILTCTLKKVSFANIEEKIKGNDDLSGFPTGDISLLLDRLQNITFDVVDANLRVYEDTVEILSFEAHSKDIRLYASGTITEAGDFDIATKIFFSPEVARELPEELSEFLTEKSRGWLSYYLHINTGEDKSFFKLETDRFRLNFEEVELK
ncbi:MAG: hypothetical protein ISS92_01530 [Candidatus Omnitrophica bacterium]|nr:hypothetical protein [Candidatus Omnitrophota bacterium]